jgi:hypothetical protein
MQILLFAGVAPARETPFGIVDAAGDAKRQSEQGFAAGVDLVVLHRDFEFPTSPMVTARPE